MRIAKLGEKELGLRATPLALLYYSQEFSRKDKKANLIEDLTEVMGLLDAFDDFNIKDADDEFFDRIDFILPLQIAWAMNKADNYGESFPQFEKWLYDLGDICFIDTGFLIEVIEESLNGFPAFRKPKQKSKSKQESNTG
ncbi:hypothetical protein SAMN06265827_105119 [Orenia metallireducens]|uniref:Uncharacterized protein n=1 Tax=Orenia metallireducens TaxID=1413210 RepID=A0A285G7A9_9FIRM|nr:hypothetical protein [Orenia metallireducens]SNY19427.1 hypothetical protein SAMN06265827_105119 [Orenia metallireducens]